MPAGNFDISREFILIAALLLTARIWKTFENFIYVLWRFSGAIYWFLVKNLAVSIFSIPVPVQAVGDSPSPALEAVWKTSGPHLSSSATAAAVPVTSMPTNTASGWQPLIRTRTSLQLRFKKHWRLATRGRECLDARSAWRPRDLNSQYKLSNKLIKNLYFINFFFSWWQFMSSFVVISFFDLIFKGHVKCAMKKIWCRINQHWLTTKCLIQNCAIKPC